MSNFIGINDLNSVLIEGKMVEISTIFDTAIFVLESVRYPNKKEEKSWFYIESNNDSAVFKKGENVRIIGRLKEKKTLSGTSAVVVSADKIIFISELGK